MKFVLVPLRLLYNLYALILFTATMLCVTPFVIAGSFFGKIKGGNFIYAVCSLWADVWFFLIGIQHCNIYDAAHDPSRQFIFVGNHNSYLDAAVTVKTLRQPVRVLGKVEMARIPVFGFIYRNAIVTVDRRSAANRANSVRILKSVLKKGISIFMFPEGTFNESTRPLKPFFDGAFRLAIETQTPLKPLLLLDAFDRMHYRSIFTLTPGRSRSVFLQEVSVAGMTMKDVPELKKQVHQLMESKLREYSAPWIR